MTYLYWHAEEDQQKISEREVGQKEVGHTFHFTKIEDYVDDDCVACVEREKRE